MSAAPGAAGMERLVEDYGERAFQFAYRLTGNADDAKELVQEAFYKVLRNWEGYDRSQPLENWFFTILRHLFLDGLKRFERANVLSLDSPAEEPGEEFADRIEDRADLLLEALEREESGRTVRLAVAGLSRQHRAVLMLADLDGLSYEEIAKVIRCPVGTVRSRVSRAREALKRLITREAVSRD